MHLANQSSGKPDKLSQGSSKLDKLSQSSMGGHPRYKGNHRLQGGRIPENPDKPQQMNPVNPEKQSRGER